MQIDEGEPAVVRSWRGLMAAVLIACGTLAGLWLAPVTAQAAGGSSGARRHPGASALAVGGGDGSSTDAFLRANYAFAQAESRSVGESVAAITARGSGIAGECPSALEFAPRDGAFGEVAEAIERSLWLANVVPVRSATIQFASRVARLEWSDRKLTRLVGVLAARERSAATVMPPAVCPSVAAWKASAYTALPVAVGSYLSRQEAIEEAAGPSEESLEGRIERRLRRHEDLRERRLAGAIARVERAFSRRLDAAWAAAQRKLEAALGASPL